MNKEEEILKRSTLDTVDDAKKKVESLISERALRTRPGKPGGHPDHRVPGEILEEQYKLGVHHVAINSQIARMKDRIKSNEEALQELNDVDKLLQHEMDICLGRIQP